MGYAVDRFGARRVLVAGLMLGGVAYVSIGLFPVYPWILCAMVLLGIANAVFHPADYAILGAVIEPSRLGKAFSIHTFAGYPGQCDRADRDAAGGRGLRLPGRRSSPPDVWDWWSRCRWRWRAGWIGMPRLALPAGRHRTSRCGSC